MQEEVKKIDNEDYLETIKKLKETTVSKEDYEKLREDNRRLLEDFINGKESAENEELQAKQTRKLDEIRKDLFKEDNSNLKFAEYALELRDAILEQGGEDPFLPVGKDVVLSSNDIESANRVAECLKDCIETADGDSAIFTNELQRRTRDISIPKRK